MRNIPLPPKCVFCHNWGSQRAIVGCSARSNLAVHETKITACHAARGSTWKKMARCPLPRLSKHVGECGGSHLSVRRACFPCRDVQTHVATCRPHACTVMSGHESSNMLFFDRMSVLNGCCHAQIEVFHHWVSSGHPKNGHGGPTGQRLFATKLALLRRRRALRETPFCMFACSHRPVTEPHLGLAGPDQ